MAEATDAFGKLKQNLKDAGCEKEMMDYCMELAHQDKWDQIPEQLRKHKQQLLSALHTSQGQIDCLDYLVYRIGKEHEQRRLI